MKRASRRDFERLPEGGTYESMSECEKVNFCRTAFAKEIIEVNYGFSKCEHSESESLLNSSFD